MDSTTRTAIAKHENVPEVQREAKTFSLWCLFTALALVAAITAWLFIPTIERWHAIREESVWIGVDGTIEATQVHASGLIDGSDWSPAWTYSYAVAGHRYISDSDALMFGYETKYYSSFVEAEQAARIRPVGKRMTVYFDPLRPDRSALDPPIWQTRDFGLLVLMLAFVAATAHFLPNLIGWRSTMELQGPENMAGGVDDVHGR